MGTAFCLGCSRIDGISVAEKRKEMSKPLCGEHGLAGGRRSLALTRSLGRIIREVWGSWEAVGLRNFGGQEIEGREEISEERKGVSGWKGVVLSCKP